MSGPDEMSPDNLADLAVTDALLDELAAARPVPVGQFDDDEAAIARLLATWRAELDDRAATVMTAPPLVLPAARPSRWVRAHQRTAAATAVVVALAASGGVAAAASGPTGPLGGLHKFIFGHPAVHHHVDTRAASAQRLLDRAGQQIDAASEAGSITAHAREHITGQLDKAAGLLAHDLHAPQSLLDRLTNLRTTLAAIPLATPAPVVTDHHGGQSGTDDNSSVDRHGSGSGSDDNQGGDRTSGSDDNRQSGSQDDSSQGSRSGDDGSQDGSSTGSDDGSGSGGGDQSGGGDGSGGGDQTSDDSGGGGGSSDGGDSSSGGSDDTTAQSSFSQNTISDDGSAEGDSHSGGE